VVVILLTHSHPLKEKRSVTNESFSNIVFGCIRWTLLILILIALVSPVQAGASQALEIDYAFKSIEASTQKQYAIYLPVMQGPPPPVMVGLYPKSWWAPNPKDVLDKEFLAADDWVGKRSSIAGVFHSLQDQNLKGNVVYLLGEIWDCGYTPFVNMYARVSAYAIASGEIDANIRAWARAYLEYVQGGDRMAFLAPLQEMNGDWVPYGQDPGNFKIAFKRIQNIFSQEGVPRDSVRWVFAPNGWSEVPFEDYYPGGQLVDVVSFSAYNFGYHPDNRYPKWKTPEETYAPYLQRMHQMAPTKPIFVAQTGTTAYTAHGWDAGAKDNWLRDAYNYLANVPGLKAIVYYNADTNNYDWTIFKAEKVHYSGYPEAIIHPPFEYISPDELKGKDLSN
jgi:hypothetical protein